MGEQRLFAFQFAADIWSGIVDSSVEIRVGANFDPLSCSSTSTVLGAAGTNIVVRDFPGALEVKTWYPSALADKLAGTDLVPGTDDIGAVFNSAIGTTCAFPSVWYYGLDGNPPAGKIDFVTVVLHELGHGLGFQTFVSLRTGAKLFGFDDTFMLDLEDHSTGILYPDMNNSERVSASTATGDLHWVGPEVVFAGVDLTAGRDPPSGHVEMYAPDPQEAGSSVSHFSTALSPDELMEPFFTGVQHDSGLAEALMADIGWGFADLPTVATPTFTPDGGTFNSALDVTISTSPSDATIRYTTDGTTPTPTHGTIYSDPVHIADTTTLKAMAHKSGWNDSAVKSDDYFIHTLTITGGPSGTPDPAASNAFLCAITKIMPSDGCRVIQFPWRWESGTISVNLDVIWGMSAKYISARLPSSQTAP